MNKQINEFKEMLYGYSEEKSNLLYKHLYLNIFTYDKNWSIKRDVAIQGYGHNILQYDKDWEVRWHVAYYTKDKNILEHLCNDGEYSVSANAKSKLKELGYE